MNMKEEFKESQKKFWKSFVYDFMGSIYKLVKTSLIKAWEWYKNFVRAWPLAVNLTQLMIFIIILVFLWTQYSWNVHHINDSAQEKLYNMDIKMKSARNAGYAEGYDSAMRVVNN